MTPNGRRRWRAYTKKCRYRSRREGKRLELSAAQMMARHPGRKLYPLPARPFTARSLVGMSQSARKRAIRALFVELVFTSQGTAIEPTDKGSRWFHLWCRGSGDAASRDPEYAALRAKYRIGERLRPCPGCLRCRSCSGCEVLDFEGERCARCGKECPSEPTQCDGSGVLPSRKQR